MSGGLPAFALGEEDASKILAAEAHLGTTSVNFQSEHYIWKRRPDGVHIINVKKMWEKLLLAARAIAAIENPADVCVVSCRPYAQRALLKFAAHTGATPIFGRFTPGCLTNQIQKNFKEPRLLVISDPRADHQAVTEASYVNIPVISFTDTDSPLTLIDIAIPCNTKAPKSIGLMWWLLAREVLLLKGKMSRQTGFVLEDKLIMPDLYFYRDPLDAEKETQGETRDDNRPKEQWGMAVAEPGKPDEFPVQAGTEPVKLDFQVPHIEDWAAASASDWNNQPPAAEGGGAATGNQWGAAPTDWS